jgi:hypothetical protein
MHSLTPEQAAIIEATIQTTDNLIVSALAGAAKTSTLVMLANELAKVKPGMEILCLAFNKKIAIEMQSRLPSTCRAMTLNSLGYRTWASALGKSRLKVNFKKNYEIMQAVIEEQTKSDQRELYPRMTELMRIVSFGKACGYIPSGEWENRAKRLMDDSEFFAHIDQKLSSLEQSIIRECSIRSIKLALKGECDFDDQILMPTLFGGSFPLYKLTLVDEAQDLSALNHEMLRKICGSRRLIAVGDQCQPAGTKVTVVDRPGDRWNAPKLRQVNIEDLQVGDKLLGYTGEGSFTFNRTVEGISQNYYEGELTIVEVAGNTSIYTENHHCYASFEPFREHFALYLMRKGKYFRLGRCKMNYECGAGPTRRAIAEGADAYWLLGVYPTERECAIEEAVAQVQFGLPDITFVCPNTNSGFATQKFLDEAWAYISASVDLEERAHQCLSYYKRIPDYPIWKKGAAAKFSLLRPSIVHACNLITGCLMLPYRGRSKIFAEQWTPANITRQWVKDLPVYSLTVSHNNLYVADNIVTHNCQAIYGFRGAHENGMEELKHKFSMRELHLTTSFRCAKEVVKAAQWRAPLMRAPEWADEGSVTTLNAWRASDLAEDAAIICRNNAPLFSLAIKLLKVGRPAELGGKDVIQLITKIMAKFGDHKMKRQEVLDNINAWLAKEKSKTKERAHAALEDRAKCMEIFALQGETLGDALHYANHSAELHSPLKLLTGHKSKGLEFENVYFLDEHLIGQEEQEPNIRYVIITRARRNLTYIQSEGYRV